MKYDDSASLLTITPNIAVGGTVDGHDIDAHFGAIFNVKAYGAVGDGATDDSTAIQAALDALYTAGSGAFYFPAGNYRI